jgi:hypothetical protein
MPEEVEIRFSPEQVTTGFFRLLELPPDLCNLIESSADNLRYALPMVHAIRVFSMHAPV